MNLISNSNNNDTDTDNDTNSSRHISCTDEIIQPHRSGNDLEENVNPIYNNNGNSDSDSDSDGDNGGNDNDSNHDKISFNTPCLGLLLEKNENINDIMRSGLGVFPYIPKDFIYPVCQETVEFVGNDKLNQPLYCIIQINFAEIDCSVVHPNFPKSGILQVYSYGMNFADSDSHVFFHKNPSIKNHNWEMMEKLKLTFNQDGQPFPPGGFRIKATQLYSVEEQRDLEGMHTIGGEPYFFQHGSDLLSDFNDSEDNDVDEDDKPIVIFSIGSVRDEDNCDYRYGFVQGGNLIMTRGQLKNKEFCLAQFDWSYD